MNLFHRKMKKFQDLPIFALDRIVKKLAIRDKESLLLASVGNNNLHSRMLALSIKKRRMICPLCILSIGTDYKIGYARPVVEDFHNQILDTYYGDINWQWLKHESEYKIVDANDYLEYCVGYFNRAGQWNDDLMNMLDNKKNNQTKILFDHLKQIYSLSNTMEFDTLSGLFEHIYSSHEKVFPHMFNIKDIEKYMMELVSEKTLIELPSISQNIVSDKILDFIHIIITSTYIYLAKRLSIVNAFCLTEDSEHKYYFSQLSMLFHISCITIKNTAFVSTTRNERTFEHILRILKLYEILAILFDRIE